MTQNLRSAVFFVFVSMLSAPEFSAQGVQYGKETELKGLTKIFVDTDGNLELHNNIVKEIFDDLPDPAPLVLVARIEDAELVLLAVSIRTPRGNPYTELKALKIVEDGTALRLLWQWGDENTSRFGRRPSSRAADHFIAKWKTHNKELLPLVEKKKR